ncbi:uncharacterized protein I303_102539 [Kwoniella dejecticola CBS 10117]|uniref:Uncharacterized protein n=1 Tax=Kwoniella dejecticola CBS 10117 TaxID=1296121 RepID=A0A1A6A907_9TREE|nr:uncharacterized protein I303_02553 [Kwoniella dejecticola CBS 10117]OBR86545.1 hypothetical protein I303_02553 [Kwoniella dejecticola CBS 10117]
MYIKSTIVVYLMSLADTLAHTITDKRDGPKDANIIVKVVGDTKIATMGQPPENQHNFHWTENDMKHPMPLSFDLQVNDKFLLKCNARVGEDFRGYETFTLSMDPFALQTANGHTAEAAAIACPKFTCLHGEEECGDIKTWDF